MRFLLIVLLFISFSYGTNSKTIIFMGVYPGIDIEKSISKRKLFKEVFSSLLVNSGVKNKNDNNFYKNLWRISQIVDKRLDNKQVKRNLGKDRYISVNSLDTKNIKLKNIFFSFLSLDDILCFSEESDYKKNIGSRRITVYNIFSFYTIELSSMRLIYSKQYILPMNKGVMNYDKDTYLTLIKENSNFYKNAIVEAVQKSLVDRNFKYALLQDKKNGIFINAKNYTLVKSKLSKKSAKRIKSRENLEFFSTYLLSTKLSNTIPMLPPFLSYKIDKDDKYTVNIYTRQFQKNLDESVEIIASMYNFKVDYNEKVTKFKVKENRLILPMFTFPTADYIIDNTLGVGSKVLEKNSIRVKKVFVAQSIPKMRFCKQAKKPSYRRKILEKNNKTKPVVYRVGYIESIPLVVKQNSDIYYYNVMFNLLNSKDKKRQFEKKYNLKCLINNNCSN